MNKGLANQDWAYLKKYTTANTKLIAGEDNDNRIVFFGDSITEFWSKEHSFFNENNLTKRIFWRISNDNRIYFH